MVETTKGLVRSEASSSFATPIDNVNIGTANTVYLTDIVLKVINFKTNKIIIVGQQCLYYRKFFQIIFHARTHVTTLFKKERPFCSPSRGVCTWMATCAEADFAFPQLRRVPFFNLLA